MDALLSAKRWTLNPSCDHLCVSRGVINWTERESTTKLDQHIHFLEMDVFSNFWDFCFFLFHFWTPRFSPDFKALLEDFSPGSRQFWKAFVRFLDTFGRNGRFLQFLDMHFFYHSQTLQGVGLGRVGSQSVEDLDPPTVLIGQLHNMPMRPKMLQGP